VSGRWLTTLAGSCPLFERRAAPARTPAVLAREGALLIRTRISGAAASEVDCTVVQTPTDGLMACAHLPERLKHPHPAANALVPCVRAGVQAGGFAPLSRHTLGSPAASHAVHHATMQSPLLVKPAAMATELPPHVYGPCASTTIIVIRFGQLMSSAARNNGPLLLQAAPYQAGPTAVEFGDEAAAASQVGHSFLNPWRLAAIPMHTNALSIFAAQQLHVAGPSHRAVMGGLVCFARVGFPCARRFSGPDLCH
jgi:hypothetical protein